MRLRFLFYRESTQPSSKYISKNKKTPKLGLLIISKIKESESNEF